MNDMDRLSVDFATRHPDMFARVLGRSDFDECEQIVNRLPAEKKADIVSRLPASHIRHLLDSPDQQPVNWLADAPFDDAVNLLSRLSRARRLTLVNSLADSDRQRDLLRHQQYPRHSIGALVADVPLLLATVSPARDAVNDLRGLDPDTIGPIVVVDIYGRYRGILDRWKLLLREPPVGQVEDFVIPLTPIRPESPVTVVALDDEWHRHNWMPVVDHQQRVLGIVSREKVMRVASQHAGSTQRSGDILLDLLDDLVFLAERMLRALLTRGGSA